ncbi:sensor histidine kinase [Nocardia sp. NPDC057227]|uniref:sensor histidine kinase n=1 Tax=Nocardia sp. NPDC057227 TaxID=3346056 RepID=UPI00364416B1
MGVPEPVRRSAAVRDRLPALRDRTVAAIRARLDNPPVDYPPSVILLADAAMLSIAIAAGFQRHAYLPTLLPVIAVGLLLGALALFTFTAVEPTPATLGLPALAATAALLAQPVEGDFAPFILVVAVGEIAAVTPKRLSVPSALVALALLIGFDLAGNLEWLDTGLAGLPMYCVGVLLGWMCGEMLRNQRRFLYQERAYQAIRSAQAADEERRRIAREVHDVIAHSLSITLLHLTAARRALQTDEDVTEATEALVDAERLGRQAMADIRRTVGLLDTRPASPAPEPGVGEIADLVGDFVRAGLDLSFRTEGDPDAVSAAAGLGLYRIGQESLANVAKHAPGASGAVRLAVGAGHVTLTVRNSLPSGRAGDPAGMGVTGMRRRAELLGGELSAGARDGYWTVRARVPLAEARSGGCCPVRGALDSGIADRERR